MFETVMVTGQGQLPAGRHARGLGGALLLHLGAAAIYLVGSLWTIGAVAPPRLPEAFVWEPAPPQVSFVPPPAAPAASVAAAPAATGVVPPPTPAPAAVQPQAIAPLAEAPLTDFRLASALATDVPAVGSGSAAAAVPAPGGAAETLPFDAARMEPPRILHRVEPAYPELARRVRKEGDVVIEAEIGADGLLHSARAVNPPLGFGLETAALEAVAGWRFLPARHQGRPVAVLYNLTVRFTLR
ncbi:MAG: energy transducer TonB [Thermoanaerobaculia bacterium]